MEIRKENLGDRREVCALIKKAFSEAEHSDGNEQELAEALRNSESFIPELSLIAMENAKIVGHILFTKVYIGKHTELALAPLSVHPEYRQRGVALALMERGHIIAKELGYEYSIVLGDPKYYTQSGYVPASVYGIKAPFDVPDENFMAVKLNEDIENICGTVRYDKAFGIE
ncbi:MAG: N-acetyltransferase [Firmicutes bacterium]|nr:N-acetyltransferase [Bacillota bacterium]